ncbi:MAG TPA: hypothetical protein VHJ99_08865 [Candidatus Dormibacteraeota bacterium]|nr:hypothetical protein [Candidatus Dormibacteraeota bacterium]
MAVNPAVFGFAAEYRADPATCDGFDEYLRIEFPSDILVGNPGSARRAGSIRPRSAMTTCT